MTSHRFTLPALLFALVLSACQSTSVKSIKDAPANMSGNHSLGKIEHTILQAGATLGWQMHVKKPGLIIAERHLRKHMAKVRINFNKHSYSISYQDSANLNYTGKSIHSTYNVWILNLNGRINSLLLTL